MIIPGTVIGTGPLQHLQVASTSCCTACRRIPVTAIGTQPLQHLQVASTCCCCACVRIPVTAIGTGPLQSTQLPSCSNLSTQITSPPWWPGLLWQLSVRPYEPLDATQ